MSRLLVGAALGACLVAPLVVVAFFLREVAISSQSFVLRGAEYRAPYGRALGPTQQQALRDLAAYRTLVLGGHVHQCHQCGRPVCPRPSHRRGSANRRSSASCAPRRDSKNRRATGLCAATGQLRFRQVPGTRCQLRGRPLGPSGWALGNSELIQLGLCPKHQSDAAQPPPSTVGIPVATSGGRNRGAGTAGESGWDPQSGTAVYQGVTGDPGEDR